MLTAYDGAILGPIAKVLGYVMNAIYSLMSHVFGIDNISLSIILLTIVIYMCLYPITYKQQKFSKLSQKMQPELQAVQKKYKDKKDQSSMQAMQQETQAIYEKYGVSPTGSCIYMLINMPILFALYRVFWNVPAYLSSVKVQFSGLVDGIMATEGYQKTMAGLVETLKMKTVQVDFSGTDTTKLSDYIIDVVYKMDQSGWELLNSKFPSLTDVIQSTHEKINDMNFFFGMNISDTPMAIIKTSFLDKSYIFIILALLIPIISYLTQVLNIKMMPQAPSNGENDAMANQMKTMNRVMPLFSLFMCFTVPVGLGIYWIISAVVRCVQQYFLNKHFEKMDLDDIIKENQEKAKKKREKMGIAENQINNAARMKTKNYGMDAKNISAKNEELLKKAEDLRANAKPNSMSAKANLVKDFNERNNK